MTPQPTPSVLIADADPYICRVFEAKLLHPLQIIFGADFLLVGRCRDFGDALLLGECRGIVGLDGFERSLHFRVANDGLIGGIDIPGRLGAERGRPQCDGRQKHGACHEFLLLHLNPLSLFYPASPASFSRPANQIE